jgi:uncharacterized membrane protein
MVERKRHLAKAVTYRFFGTFGTAAIAYAVSGDMKIGAAVGVIDSVAKIGLYYAHERLWYRIRWGVQTHATGHETEVKPATPRVVVRSDSVREMTGEAVSRA